MFSSVIDCELMMKEHISEGRKCLLFHLQRLRQIRRLVRQQAIAHAVGVGISFVSDRLLQVCPDRRSTVYSGNTAMSPKHERVAVKTGSQYLGHMSGPCYTAALKELH